jgi:phosphoglycolate phosphatase
MSYKAVIFDMDGTVLNTLEDLCDSFNESFRHYSLPEISIEDTRKYVGNGILRAIEQAVPYGTKKEIIDDVFTFMKDYYPKHSEEKTDAYPGVRELIRDLYDRGIKLAIVSNKIDSAVKSLSKKYFGDYIKIAVGEKKGIKRKPAPDSVLAAIKELDVSLSDTVYVGDSEVDVKTALNAGVDCISVLWGYRDKDVLIKAGAKVFAKTPEEVKNIIMQKA